MAQGKAPPDGGQQALALSAAYDGSVSTQIAIHVPLCGGTVFSGPGLFTFTMEVYFGGTEPFGGNFSILYKQSNGSLQGTLNLGDAAPSPGHWYTWTGQMDMTSPVTDIGVMFSPTDTAWHGTIYIDNVRMTFP
ncbi:MAG: hypothetical protein ABIQ16_18150 [Polyangiaceae bacterium]